MSGPRDRPARRRWVISLRVLMVLIVGLAIGIAWVTNRARSQREAVAAIVGLGGSVSFDYQYRNGLNNFNRNAEPSGPKWLRRLVGDEYFREAVRVILPRRTPLPGRQGSSGPTDSRPDDVMRFVGMLTSVKLLTIFREQATDEGLHQIGGLKNLETLWIQDAENLTDTGFAALRGMTRLEQLNILNAKHLTDTGASYLAGLKNLTELRIAKSEVSDQGFTYLKGLTKLEKLTLHSDRVTDLGLAQLKEMTRLEALNLSSPHITDDGLAHLGNLNRLQTLWIPFASSIAGPGLSHLSGLPRLSNLRLTSDTLSDDGLAYLKGLPQLVVLNVNSPLITDAGLVHLEGLIRLEDLSLSSPHITDAGLAHLARTKTLKSLRLENAAQFTDRALDQLTGLVNLEALQIETKDENTNQITDLGLDVLKQLPQLKLAIINGSRISDGALKKLQKERPGLRIRKRMPRPPDARPGSGVSPGATPAPSRRAS